MHFVGGKLYIKKGTKASGWYKKFDDPWSVPIII